jgi:CRISPR/Cas system CMR subunit Cmr4 (Cas7 group RAMP superfamily)
MSSNAAIFYLARIHLESVTPLSISTGSPDQVFDSSLVRDANDLPGIPGTSVAGVLRHLYLRSYEESAEELFSLFGTQDGKSASASRLQISWGCIESQQGVAVEGLWEHEKINNDPLLRYAHKGLEEPDYRNRVRIKHRGAAARQGKYDRTILPAGYRFWLELSLRGNEEDAKSWLKILKLFYHPAFRLGGGTRSGLGAFRTLSIHQRAFHLNDPKDQQSFVSLAPDLYITEGLQIVTLEAKHSMLRAKVKLHQHEGQGWRIGSGSHPLKRDGSKDPDLTAITENVVDWSGNTPSIVEKLLIPASSIKGALAHRLVFHYARRKQIWAESLLPKISAECNEVDTAVDWAWQQQKEFAPLIDLLGSAKDASASGSSDNRAGVFYLNDSYVEIPNGQNITVQPHNAIDTFTGGVRQRMLFSEEIISDQSIILEFFIEESHYKMLDDTVKLALKDALDDLAAGRLAIGAASGRGHGFFKGSVTHFEAQQS